jgi:hypothetical protein
MAKLNDSRSLVLAMLMQANDNQDWITTNINDLTNYLNNAASKFTGTNEFELVYHGRLNALTNPSSVIVVREKSPIQGPDGRWIRAYGFADGHSEYHKAEPDGDFERWEKSHSALSPQSP